MTYKGKRTLDLLIAVPALLASLPIQAVAAISIRITMGKPVLFSQTRPGLNGELFEMRKFRTMHHVDPERGLLDDSSRLTKLGSILRSSSVDELPTLMNVITGDMSIVGPRPLLVKYLELYSPTQARRMEVPPGLTGLAQINGRNLQSWDERFAYDLEYVESCSLKLDLQIILRTFSRVLRREGITAAGHVSMPNFTGNTQRNFRD